MSQTDRIDRTRRVGGPALTRRVLLGTAGAAVALPGLGLGQDRPGDGDVTEAPPGPALETGFADPPTSARAHAWWHWIAGNVTKDGIAKDLAWMSRSGLGGLQHFVADIRSETIVAERLDFMTPPWRDAFRFAVAEADRLGLEFAVASSPGWSATGGPWVPPEDGMKKLVWSETPIPEIEPEGGRFEGTLAALPTVAGPFGAMPAQGLEELGSHGVPTEAGGDTIVLAVRDLSAPPLAPRLSAGGAALDLAAGPAEVPVGPVDEPAHVLAELDAPTAVRSATVFLPGAGLPGIGERVVATLEVGERGAWRVLRTVPNLGVPTTVSFPAVEACRVRLALSKAPGPETLGYGRGDPGAVPSAYDAVAKRPDKVPLVQFTLSADARVHAFEAKAGFGTVLDYHALALDGEDRDGALGEGDVIDVTAHVGEGGRIDWAPPPGRWRLLRMGWSLTGATNHPGGPATGLEVDKYDAAAVGRYLDAYLGLMREAAGPDLFGGRGVTGLLNDSVEIGPSNWTPLILDHFRRLRDYDPVRWLPALTGRLVGSRAESDTFLFDFRRTLADLLAEQHYATVAERARAEGLTTYAEALERARPIIGDDLAMRAHADVPCGAFWVYDRAEGPQPAFLADVKGAASIAHVRGTPLVGVECLTTFNEPWTHGPGDLKPVLDMAFAGGMTRMLLHASTHQPVDDRVPGMSLGIFGQYLTRHETWAGLARPWFDYVARTSFLLQQGRAVADIGFFTGEEAPLTALFLDAGPGVPPGFDHDYLNAGLLAELKVDGGRIVSAGGASYAVLYLGGSSRRLTLPTLRKLGELAEEGATLIGARPGGSPSLADDPAEVERLLALLWPGGGAAEVGEGRVIATDDLAAGLGLAGVVPDLLLPEGAPIAFAHRTNGEADLYFLSNRSGEDLAFHASFRTDGRAPEVWRADDGSRVPASFERRDGRTVVPLAMTADEALFVVFRAPTSAAGRTVPAPAWEAAGTVEGPWEVAFQPGRGTPPRMTLPVLASLTEHADLGVRHFSGVATYEASFALPEGVRPGEPLVLDLGRVGDVAAVRVNGIPVGIAWHAPYRLDVGGAVREGDNRLEVDVVALWRNRLIGDAQPSATSITFTTAPTYRPDAALRPSGLMGPVTLWRQAGA